MGGRFAYRIIPIPLLAYSFTGNDSDDDSDDEEDESEDEEEEEEEEDDLNYEVPEDQPGQLPAFPSPVRSKIKSRPRRK